MGPGGVWARETHTLGGGSLPKYPLRGGISIGPFGFHGCGYRLGNNRFGHMWVERGYPGAACGAAGVPGGVLESSRWVFRGSFEVLRGVLEGALGIQERLNSYEA